MAKGQISNSHSGRFLKQVGNQTTTREYRNKEAIYLQGDVADALFYIQSGTVKLTVLSNRGKRAVIGILGQGDSFGESCLEKQSQRSSTATAIHQSTIARVTKGELSRLIRQEPAFARVFVSHLLSRISRAEGNLRDQLFNNSETRLAQTLVQLSSFGKHSNPEGTTLKVSQGTLAEMIGTTRSRVSFFMNRFRKMGLIHYNGGLQVHKSLLALVLKNGNRKIK